MPLVERTWFIVWWTTYRLLRLTSYPETFTSVTSYDCKVGLSRVRHCLAESPGYVPLESEDAISSRQYLRGRPSVQTCTSPTRLVWTQEESLNGWLRVLSGSHNDLTLVEVNLCTFTPSTPQGGWFGVDSSVWGYEYLTNTPIHFASSHILPVLVVTCPNRIPDLDPTPVSNTTPLLLWGRGSLHDRPEDLILIKTLSFRLTFVMS